MSNVSKAFGSNIALDNVSLELFPGAVHALMGENGAGKSTLMKILAGVVPADQGDIALNGQRITNNTPKEALDNGISTVFQELSLLSNLSIAENMFLGKEKVTPWGNLDRKTMLAKTADTLQELNLELDPTTLVSELSIAERQFIEIGHGIKANAQVVILDEPTAALNAADVEILNRHIRRLKEQGKAIVYISHRMDEIFNICDTVSVLKDGRNVATCSIGDVTPKSLVEMMVGRDIKDLFPARGVDKGEQVLSMQNFKITADAKPLALSLHRGEIVALAGLEGQGQRELLRSLIGQHQPQQGNVKIKDHALTMPVPTAKGVRKLQGQGIGFVPEDRKDEGLFLGLAIEHNIGIALHAAQSQWAWQSSHKKRVSKTMSSMSMKAPSAATTVGSLSGGNQQKALLGRYLAADMDILLIEEPTRGVDIGAKAEIYQLLRDFTNNGGAILVSSRETVELIGICDRLFVVHDNTIVEEMLGNEATEQNILNAALGV